MSHWIEKAIERGGLGDEITLDLDAGASLADAWQAATETLGVETDDIARAVAKAFSMPLADVASAEPTAQRLLSGKVARKFGVFPLADHDRYLLVATADPTDSEANQAVAFASGRHARFAIASPERIATAINEVYAPDLAAASLLSQLDADDAEVSDVAIDDGLDDQIEQVSEAEIAAGPIVKLTNVILHEAVARGASDVHIQPIAGQGLVRFRQDGVLHNGMRMPLPVLSRVVSRIKIMAHLDIADRLRAQDGRARIVAGGRRYDLRVSTVPTRRAEKAVIRLLDTQGAGMLSETGIEPEEVERIRGALSHRDGIIVVTGPTGSGKTTTIYGALREISTEDVNIMTVEDPVEYELPRLTQIQVEHKQGMTFASALRAILRQDPDVIFVGEIRDEETAEIAAQASLTGHLVLATLHTNDAVGSLRRFLDLGLDPATVGETLRASLAQRLLRRVCQECAEPVGQDLSPEEDALAAKFATPPVVRAKGCDKCVGQGYLGRIPVTEFMVSTPTLVRMMLDGSTPFELQQQAVRDGMSTMLDSALRRVAAGETTLEEVDRVVGGVGRQSEDPAGPGKPAHPAEPAHPGEPAHSGVNGAPTTVSEARPIAPDTTVAPPAVEAPMSHPEPGIAPSTPTPWSSMLAGPERMFSDLDDLPGAADSAPPSPGLASDSPQSVPIPPTTPAPPVGPPPPVQDASGSATSILLVDDDPDTRLFADHVLTGAGYVTADAENGSEALLRLARGESFALMLLDLDMPRMGGRDVLRAVRRSIATSDLPVIVLTSAPDKSTETELLAMGANDYLRKPIEPSMLLARVGATLERTKG